MRRRAICNSQKDTFYCVFSILGLWAKGVAAGMTGHSPTAWESGCLWPEMIWRPLQPLLHFAADDPPCSYCSYCSIPDLPPQLPLHSLQLRLIFWFKGPVLSLMRAFVLGLFQSLLSGKYCTLLVGRLFSLIDSVWDCYCPLHEDHKVFSTHNSLSVPLQSCSLHCVGDSWLRMYQVGIYPDPDPILSLNLYLWLFLILHILLQHWPVTFLFFAGEFVTMYCDSRPLCRASWSLCNTFGTSI